MHFSGFPAEVFGWPDVRKSLSCGHVTQCASVGGVGSAHGRTARNSPGSPRGWRRIRWLKHRGMAIYLTGLCPSIGGASGNVDCGGSKDRNVEEISRLVDGIVDVDALADGKCDGHDWCHKRADISHSTRQRIDSLGAVSLAASSCLSSCLSVCPPLARPAPGSSSFPPCVVPLLPSHSALGGGDAGVRLFPFSGVGTLARPLCADASVARPRFSAPVGSPASCGSLHPVGPCRLPSQGLASARHSVRVDQSECCSVSAQRGWDAAAASLSKQGLAPIQSSHKFILNRQVTIVDLGLAGSCVTVSGRSVVGPQASGRQPQKLLSSSHYVSCLRGGGSAAASSSGGGVADGGDVGGAGSVVLADEAAGSGVGDDRGILNDDGGGIVSAASAGVLAKEEGCMDDNVGHAFPIFIEGYRPHPRVGFVFSPFNVSPCPNSPKFRFIFYDAPPEAPRGVSSASSTRSSHVVGGDQDGNRGRLTALDNGALGAPSNNRVDAGNVKEELAVRSSVARSSVVRSSVVSRPVSYRVSVVNCAYGPPIEMRLVGRQWVEPGPISNEWSAWYRPNVRRPVKLTRSSSVEVGPPSAGHASENASVDRGDTLGYPGVGDLKHQFDDVLVQCYGYPANGRRLFPSCTPLYNNLRCGARQWVS